MTSTPPQEMFQSIEDELRGAAPAHDVKSAVISDEDIAQHPSPAWNNPPGAQPESRQYNPPIEYDPPADGPVRMPQRSHGLPLFLFGRVIIPASLLRISIAFSAFYTGVSIAQKLGFVAKPYIPSIAAIAILITIDQLRWCEFIKRKQFTVLFWVAIISLVVARSSFGSYSCIATVVLYIFCHVNSRAPKFLPADCAMGAIATWLFI